MVDLYLPKELFAVDHYWNLRPSSTAETEQLLSTWLRHWIQEAGLADTEERRKIIVGWRIPRITTLVNPHYQSEYDLQLFCAWGTWWHLFDDEFDKPPIFANPAKTAAAIDPYRRSIERLQTGEQGRNASSDTLLRAFENITSRFASSMSTAWRTRWLANLRAWLDTYLVEAHNKYHGVPPTPVELIEHKRVCMAQRPTLDLTDRTIGRELSTAAHELLSPLVDCISDITGALNDPVSLSKERACGDVHNLILSLMHHRGLTEDAALLEVQELVNNRCDYLISLAESIPELNILKNEREAVRQWIATAVSWVHGYRQWASNTARF